MLWKLPLPVSDGLQYWTEQETTSAAFEFHRAFIKDVVLPHMTIFGPIVFLPRLAFAVSMILGLAVRLVGVLAIAYVLQLLARPLWQSVRVAVDVHVPGHADVPVCDRGCRPQSRIGCLVAPQVPAVRTATGLIGWFFNMRLVIIFLCKRRAHDALPARCASCGRWHSLREPLTLVIWLRQESLQRSFPHSAP